MHEMSLMNDLVRKIEREACEHGQAPVVAVRVVLGALSHISPEHFREHFADAVRGTPLDGAVLSIATSDDINDPQAQDILLESVELAER